MKKVPFHNLSQNTDEAGSDQIRVSPLNISSGYDFTSPHRHNYYEMFVFEKGGGWHEIDFIRYPVEDKSIHFVAPGQVHTLKRDPGSFGNVIIFGKHFQATVFPGNSSPVWLPFTSNFCRASVIRTDDAVFKEIVGNVGIIRSELEKGDRGISELLPVYLKAILLRCKASVPVSVQEEIEDPASGQSVMRRFADLLESRFRENHLVKDYAAALNLSPENLNEVSKKQSGKTASEFIGDRIMLEIKRLLMFSDQSVKEIAFMTGFEDPSNFGKFVRAQTGHAPSLLRKKLQEDLNARGFDFNR